MQNIKSYVNTKKEMELVKVNLEAIDTKEKYLKDLKSCLNNLEIELEVLTKKMEEKLKELEGIEQELLYAILVKGMNATKAVDNVAFKNDKDVSTIWKGYYPKVKEKLIEIGYYASENPVK